jgi:hypothetical protein
MTRLAESVKPAYSAQQLFAQDLTSTDVKDDDNCKLPPYPRHPIEDSRKRTGST